MTKEAGRPKGTQTFLEEIETEIPEGATIAMIGACMMLGLQKKRNCIWAFAMHVVETGSMILTKGDVELDLGVL